MNFDKASLEEGQSLNGFRCGNTEEIGMSTPSASTLQNEAERRQRFSSLELGYPQKNCDVASAHD